MNAHVYNSYLEILKEELIPALGCTEPIAIAYCAATARAYLGEIPERMVVKCSGNIIKNVKSVVVPFSNGMKGIEAAAVLGMLGGKAEKKLEVLASVSEAHILEANRLIKKGMCTTSLLQGVAKLNIIVEVYKGENHVLVEIFGNHTNIVRIEKNGYAVMADGLKEQDSLKDERYDLLTLRDIFEFACTVKPADIKEHLDYQANLNSEIANEGLQGAYGMCVGATLLKYYDKSIHTLAKALPAAGSDARMGGCGLPVVINSGSGNQGLTASLPVIAYADYLNVSETKKYRALVLSNLVAIYQKKHLGKLSAYCGAASAACGSGAAIAYLYDENYETLCKTIINTLGNVSGIVCDGAKASCAAKIASCVDAAIMGYHMAKEEHCFAEGDGIVKETADKTIETVGRLGREGMGQTDIEILNIMLEK